MNPPFKILYIEDEPFISEVFARALRKCGYEVTVIADGEEGLTAALGNGFQIILLDIYVPTMTGLDILQRLKTLQPPLDAKIIIATNLDQGAEERARVEKQVDGYFIKAETTPRQLVAFIQTLLPTTPPAAYSNG